MCDVRRTLPALAVPSTFEPLSRAHALRFLGIFSVLQIKLVVAAVPLGLRNH